MTKTKTKTKFQIKSWAENLLFEHECETLKDCVEYAVLSGADLSGADLSGAVLSGADLRNADLRNADLRNADLRNADLQHIMADFIAEVIKLPDEIPALRQALLDGKIDGTTYSGKCACLAGTLAHAKGLSEYTGGNIPINGITYRADASSPRESWFWNIKKGDTPETNQCAKIALEWIDEALAIISHIRKTGAAA